MKWLFLRELKLAWQQRADAWMALGFYMTVVALFPLGFGLQARVGAEQGASGALWIALLLAVMLTMPGLYRRDAEDGTLAQWRSMRLPMELVVLSKFGGMLCFLLLPLLIITPLMAVILEFPTEKLPHLLWSLSIGMLALFSIGSVGAALMADNAATTRSSFLFLLLILPLCIPVLIFGSAASVTDSVFSEGLQLLLSFSFAAIPLGIWLSSSILREIEL